MNLSFRNRRPIRVLLVEDNDVYAETIELLLGASETIEVVGRARDGAEGCTLAAALEPDCVLMDISMPVMDGFEATAVIGMRQPDVRVVMLTSSDDTHHRARAEQVGASAYLTKESPLGELEAAVTGPAASRVRRRGHAWRARLDAGRSRPRVAFSAAWENAAASASCAAPRSTSAP